MTATASRHEWKLWFRKGPKQWRKVKRDGEDGEEVSEACDDSSSTDIAPMEEDCEVPLPPPTRDLFDLIADKSWHRAIRLCESNSRLAHYTGDNNTPTTCLFVACQNRPPVRIIQCLLKSYPEASRLACVTDEDETNQWLPLHMACRYN